MSTEEHGLLDAPVVRAGASAPRLLTTRPFLWLVLAQLFGHGGFWAFEVAMLNRATYRFDAGPGELAIFNGVFSATFVLGTPVLSRLIDRWSPKWMYVAASVLSFLAMAEGFVAPSIGWLYVAPALEGVAFAVIFPARGALTALLVREEDLVRANGMISAASELAIVLGPLGAALLTGLVGTDVLALYVLTAVALSFGAAVLLPDLRAKQLEEHLGVRSLLEGFRVVARTPELRALVVAVIGVFLGLAVLVSLEPLFLRHDVGAGPSALGFTYAAHGTGAFLGAVAVARIRRGAGREVRIIAAGIVVAGVGYLAYAAPAWFPSAVVGSLVFGVGFALYLPTSNALIQRVSPEAVRGRVIGAFGMLQEAAFIAATAAIVGAGTAIPVHGVLVASAAGVLVLGVAFGARRRRVSEVAP